MAITKQYSNEYNQLYLDPNGGLLDAVQLGARMRIATFTHTQVGVGDTGSSIVVVKLPPGKVALYMSLSTIRAEFTASGARLSVGWDAYRDKQGRLIAADPAGLVSSTGVGSPFKDGVSMLQTNAGTGITIDNAYIAAFDALEGVDITISNPNSEISDGDKSCGNLVYAID